MTKVEAIKQLMLDNGGIASWKMIYSQIENYYPNAKKSKEWQAGLRGVLYRDVGSTFKKISEGLFATIDYNEYNNLPKEIISDMDTEKEITTKVRLLQQKFRKELLKVMPSCPITEITQKKLLFASHIKPWCFSSADEKIDVYNGFILSPLYDKLFDLGFITFSDDKYMLISPALDKFTVNKLNIKEKIYPNLDTKGREKYLDFHRKNIFLN